MFPPRTDQRPGGGREGGGGHPDSQATPGGELSVTGIFGTHVEIFVFFAIILLPCNLIFITILLLLFYFITCITTIFKTCENSFG